MDGTPGYHDEKAQVLARLRRIEGQVRGLQRLVEEDTYCIDVLTQLAAVTKALQGVGLRLLDEHLRHCVVGAARSPHGDTPAETSGDGDDLDALVHEAMTAIERLLRS